MVSEETGKISYAKDGGLHRDITPQNLRDILSMEFSESSPEEVKGIFRKGDKNEESEETEV